MERSVVGVGGRVVGVAVAGREVGVFVGEVVGVDIAIPSGVFVGICVGGVELPHEVHRPRP